MSEKETEPTFSISTNNSWAVFSAPVWNCPKHGKVTNVSFSDDGKVIGEYCFHCYHEFIKANVTAVTPA